jgi:DNA-binding Lrp family transcriptional regulator
MMKKNAFPEEPLDSKDRQLIQVAYGYRAEGVGFNQLVKAAESFASRSTVALRVERLVRLGYLERISVERPGKVKPIRVTFKCLSLMHTLELVRAKAMELKQDLYEAARELETGKENRTEGRPERFKKLYEELRQRWNGLFGMVGSLAVFYGRSAAGDLFLPLVMDDYLQISMEHFSLLQSDPEFRSASMSILNERMAGSGTDLDTIRIEMKELLKQWTDKTTPSSVKK